MVKPEESSKHVSADSNPSPLMEQCLTRTSDTVAKLLAVGWLYHCYIANDEVSHITSPGPVIKTTPCHLLSFLLFTVLPTA